MVALRAIAVLTALAAIAACTAAPVVPSPSAAQPSIEVASTAPTPSPSPASTSRSRVVARIPIAGVPEAIVIDRVARRAYVRTAESVVCVDLDRLTALSTLPVDDGNGVTGIAYDRSSGLAYTTKFTSGRLAILRSDPGGSLTDVATVDLGGPVGPLAVDEATHRLFVVDIGRSPARPEPRPGRLLAVNGNTRELVATIALAGYPSSIAVSGATGRVYVSEGPAEQGASGLVQVFDAETLREITRIGVSPGGSLALDERSNALYMTSSVDAPAGRQITFIDGRTARAQTFFAPTSVRAYTIGFDDVRGHIYLASLEGALQIGLLRTGSPIPLIDADGLHDVGAEPAGIAADPLTHRVFVASRSGALTVLVDDLPPSR